MRRPPGPFQPDFWRSPLRGPWLTSLLSLMLLAAVAIVAVTGFLSHAAYRPDLPGNAIVDPARDLPLLVSWPTGPSWLYALTQGLHVSVGLATVPLLLAKLWSVIPKLFKWPPARTPAEGLERAIVGLLVASTIFQLVTGVMNAQYWYAFGFDFVVAHYWGAVLFVGALLAHMAVKLPAIRRAYRTRAAVMADSELVAASPAEPTMSRRGLLAFTGASAGLVLLAQGGQALGGPFRSVSFLAPRREDFPVNKPFAIVGIERAEVGPSWRLELAVGGQDAVVELAREDLLAMDLATERLPIACVEGWSTMQEWTGVRLRDLAARAGVEPGSVPVRVESLQPEGRFRAATLSAAQVAEPRSLLALQVNGADLSLDHGYPARIIVPALPGVHNTKWVGRMNFDPQPA